MKKALASLLALVGAFFIFVPSVFADQQYIRTPSGPTADGNTDFWIHASSTFVESVCGAWPTASYKQVLYDQFGAVAGGNGNFNQANYDMHPGGTAVAGAHVVADHFSCIDSALGHTHNDVLVIGDDFVFNGLPTGHLTLNSPPDGSMFTGGPSQFVVSWDLVGHPSSTMVFYWTGYSTTTAIYSQSTSYEVGTTQEAFSPTFGWTTGTTYEIWVEAFSKNQDTLFDVSPHNVFGVGSGLFVQGLRNSGVPTNGYGNLPASPSSTTGGCPDFGFLTPLCDGVLWFLIPNTGDLIFSTSATWGVARTKFPFSYVDSVQSAWSAAALGTSTSTIELDIPLPSTASSSFGNLLPSQLTFFSTSTIYQYASASTWGVLRNVLALVTWFGTVEMIYFGLLHLLKPKS